MNITYRSMASPHITGLRTIRELPRFGAPIAADKIRMEAAPPTVYELLEDVTAALPVGIPGVEIGAGIGVDAAGYGSGSGSGSGAGAGAGAGAGGTGAPRAARAPRADAALLGGPIVGALPAQLEELDKRIQTVMDRKQVQITEDAYIPANRRNFKQFIIQTYRRFILPKPGPLDEEACAKAAESAKKGVKSFAYQSFVRDYIQKPTPYRGVLVYHGLGSGKTCTSIAAMEALYQFDKSKPIFVMTPASLNPNYRDEIKKCGPFIFRTDNFWRWVAVPALTHKTPEAALLIERVGIPVHNVRKLKGGWLPDPTQKPNFDALTSIQQQQIREQIDVLMSARISFIHYNGITERTIRQWACETPQKFDGATIIIDETHNLVRTINNAALDVLYKDEARDMPTYVPKFCNVAGKYRISYLLYRMICNAVGCKIIALSATPIINFPQEIAILANILAGDTRMVEANIAGLARRDEMLAFLKKHPEVDFAEVIPRPERSVSTLRMTPVPSGCRKVIDPVTKQFRGFVRNEIIVGAPEEIARERSLDVWFERIRVDFKAAGFSDIASPTFTAVPRLPDVEKQFRELFIDTDSLVVKTEVKLPLMARLSGLISYYKGGKADLMARVGSDETVYVDMSSLQLKKYSDMRKGEIDIEIKKKKPVPGAAGAGAGGAGGRIGYSDVTTTMNSTFKIFSRASCNFVFPGDMKRPIPKDYRDIQKMVGARIGQQGDGDLYTGVDNVDLAGAAGAAGDEVPAAADEGAVVAAESEAAAAADAAEAAVASAEPGAAMVGATYEAALAAAVAELRSNAPTYFAKGSLENISPKFQAICDRLAVSPGPALVYSNFKTLEGVGLFGVALEVQLGYKKFDIVKTPVGWRLSPETLTAGAGVLRYIMYTGDEEREKRRTLLDIFNNKWGRLSTELVAQVKELTGTDTNLRGGIAKVFMITQSGAEGISLSNVRQVHIMEPYWNYVRLEQVKGRAIRICSHMDLPAAERSVDVFTYIARFSEAQRERREIIETLINFDGGKTTDESIFELMKAKKKLADSISDVMQKSAVDCELNGNENGTVGCYRFEGVQSSEDYLYHPLVETHLRESAVSER